MMMLDLPKKNIYRTVKCFRRSSFENVWFKYFLLEPLVHFSVLILKTFCLSCGNFRQVKHPKNILIEPFVRVHSKNTWAWWFLCFCVLFVVLFFNTKKISMLKFHLNRSLSLVIFQFHLSNYPI